MPMFALCNSELAQNFRKSALLTTGISPCIQSAFSQRLRHIVCAVMELLSVATVILSPIIILLAIDYYLHHDKRGRWVDKIPGPKSLPIIGNAMDLMVPMEDLWNFLRRCSRDFYPVYKFWILNWPIVNIRHPDDVEILMSSSKNIEKSLFYDLLHPWLNEGLLTSTGDKWRTRRKILTPAFHFNVLQEFVDTFVEHTDRLIATLKNEAKSGEVVKELLPMYSTQTLNVICETSMGMSVDEKDKSQREYKKSIYEIGEIFYFRAIRPWVKSEWIFRKTVKGREQTKALKILHDFSSKIIGERKEYHEKTGGKYLNEFSDDSSKIRAEDVSIRKTRKRLAFLDLLIAARKANGINDAGIREEVDTFVFEGHDTTAMGFFFATLLLAEHKDVQAKCREEVRRIMKETVNGKITIKEVQKLNYLDRCIKESLRLYPSVPSIGRKITEDIQLKNCFLAKGTTVNIHIVDIHRDPNFWPRPNIFDPDRFLPEQSEGRHPFAYVPFSAGPRNCIGQKFAMLELKTTLAGLLNNFYLEPMDTAASVRITPDLVLRTSDPVHIKLIPIVK